MAFAAASYAEEVRVRLAAGEVRALDMEVYVAGVVGKEMPASWPADALKAQAVASRTYALSRKLQRADRPWHLDATVRDQVFHEDAAAQALAAARATAGEVLVHGSEPAEAFFHSACGGRTESARAAFGREVKYLTGVDDGEADAGSPRAAWEARAPFRAVEVLARTPSGRAERVRVRDGAGTRVYTGADFRALLGWSALPSLLFDVAAGEDGAVVLRGRGSGHGVGMCQWGARGLAAAGWTYREILAHYYPGTEIRRMY
jgi:stage II sporulation protein D